MMLYEIKASRNIFNKVWSEIYMLLFFNLGLLLGNFVFFTKNYVIIEFLVFCLLLFRLVNKRNRYVFRIELDEVNKILKVSFYQFIFLKFEQKIPFNLLNVNYKYKTYKRGIAPKTLEIRQGNSLVVEIKQKYNLGWTNKELDEINENLKNYLVI